MADVPRPIIGKNKKCVELIFKSTSVHLKRLGIKNKNIKSKKMFLAKLNDFKEIRKEILQLSTVRKVTFFYHTKYKKVIFGGSIK